jgi:hypothetical protein
MTRPSSLPVLRQGARCAGRRCPSARSGKKVASDAVPTALASLEHVVAPSGPPGGGRVGEGWAQGRTKLPCLGMRAGSTAASDAADTKTTALQHRAGQRGELTTGRLALHNLQRGQRRPSRGLSLGALGPAPQGLVDTARTVPHTAIGGDGGKLHPREHRLEHRGHRGSLLASRQQLARVEAARSATSLPTQWSSGKPS